LIVRKEIKRIKAVLMDVDGVLTDGSFWLDSDSLEMKRFCFADRTGISLAQKAGIKIGLVSGESSPSGMAIVSRYAKKLKINDVYKGCHDKAKAVIEYAKKYNFGLSEICFIGDDIIDLPALKIVGLSVCPKDAHSTIVKVSNIVTKRSGGAGAVRELLDLLLSVKG